MTEERKERVGKRRIQLPCDSRVQLTIWMNSNKVMLSNTTIAEMLACAEDKFPDYHMTKHTIRPLATSMGIPIKRSPPAEGDGRKNRGKQIDSSHLQTAVDTAVKAALEEYCLEYEEEDIKRRLSESAVAADTRQAVHFLAKVVRDLMLRLGDNIPTAIKNYASDDWTLATGVKIRARRNGRN